MPTATFFAVGRPFCAHFYKNQTMGTQKYQKICHVIVRTVKSGESAMSDSSQFSEGLKEGQEAFNKARIYNCFIIEILC